jgi:hypothetical protein
MSSLPSSNGQNGHANGSVEALQTGLPTANGSVDAVQNDLPAANGSVTAVQNGPPTANGSVNAVQNGLPTANGSVDAAQRGASNKPYKAISDFLSNTSRFKIIESTLREGEQFLSAFFDTGKFALSVAIFLTLLTLS